MRYAGIKENDTVNGEGICVSFWTQGCPHRCKGCHNPETWNFDGGYEKPIEELAAEILDLIKKDGIKRNFSVLGGEPLCEENIYNTEHLIRIVRLFYPDITIFLWTGYLYEDLLEKSKNKDEYGFYMKEILKRADVIIDGPYIEEERDVTLELRGSRNQRIWRRENMNDLEEIKKFVEDTNYSCNLKHFSLKDILEAEDRKEKEYKQSFIDMIKER